MSIVLASAIYNRWHTQAAWRRRQETHYLKIPEFRGIVYLGPSTFQHCISAEFRLVTKTPLALSWGECALHCTISEASKDRLQRGPERPSHQLIQLAKLCKQNKRKQEGRHCCLLLRLSWVGRQQATSSAVAVLCRGQHTPAAPALRRSAPGPSLRSGVRPQGLVR